MTFTDDEISSILSDFPKFELSYEMMTHKKVYDYNVILAIPNGPKCFAWFTSYKEDNVCFIMEVDNNSSDNSNSNKKNNVTNIHICLTSFDDKLAYGTIFYGTCFSVNGSSCFCIEDLYYYKGVNYSGKTFINRLETIKHILKGELCQKALTCNYTIFGLPLMGTDLLTMLKDIEQLPYKPMYLKYRWYETKKIMCAEYYSKPNRQNYDNNMLNKKVEMPDKKTEISDKKVEIPVEPKKPIQSQLSNAVFHITPDIRSDIYNLFIYNNGKMEFYDYAFIPDYETSVKMNALFRNIKENNNLDALEESDDEDDFENERTDKYVYLDKSYRMKCLFNYKFKKWTPISVVNTKEQIVSYDELQYQNLNENKNMNKIQNQKQNQKQNHNQNYVYKKNTYNPSIKKRL